jgi:hypothetical protein
MVGKQMVELREMKPDELKNWDKLVDQSQNSTLFHTLKGLKIAEKHLNCRLYPLIGLKGEEIVMIFPIFFRKKGIAKMVLSPPPRGGIPYLGPSLVMDKGFKRSKMEEMFMTFTEKFDLFIKKELKPNYTSITTNPGVTDVRKFKWLGYSIEPMYTYIIDLQLGEEKLWNGFRSSLRRDIKKADKKVQVVEGKKEDLDFIYEAMIRRYEEQQMAYPPSKGYYEDLFEAFYPESLRLLVAEIDGRKIGGIVLICYKDTVYFWAGLPRPKEVESVPINEFIQWETIKWAQNKGYKYYDLIGANTPRLCQFKQKYNPKLEMYYRIKKATFAGRIMENVYLKMLKR